MTGYFENVCICSPPSTWGMGERAGWEDWRCPSCGRLWGLEHYYAKDGSAYLGCSWIGADPPALANALPTISP